MFLFTYYSSITYWCVFREIACVMFVKYHCTAIFYRHNLDYRCLIHHLPWTKWRQSVHIDFVSSLCPLWLFSYQFSRRCPTAAMGHMNAYPFQIHMVPYFIMIIMNVIRGFMSVTMPLKFPESRSLPPPNGEGYVFVFVHLFICLSACLSVSNITEKKWLSGFSWNFQDIWHWVQGTFWNVLEMSHLTLYKEELFFSFFAGTRVC